MISPWYQHGSIKQYLSLLDGGGAAGANQSVKLRLVCLHSFNVIGRTEVDAGLDQRDCFRPDLSPHSSAC